MALKKASKVTSMYTQADYAKLAKEYDDINAQLKVLEERKKFLADTLKSGAQEIGVKDSNGSFYIDSDSYIIGKVASKSVKLNQARAIELLEKKGLDDCIDTITSRIVNEDKVEKAVAGKKITVKELETVTDINVSYKISVKAKEEVPVVEQTKLSVAKTKKK